VFFLIGEISPKGQIQISNFAKLNDFFWRLSIAISERGGEKKGLKIVGFLYLVFSLYPKINIEG
jgi:hypothetical protein